MHHFLEWVWWQIIKFSPLQDGRELSRFQRWDYHGLCDSGFIRCIVVILASCLTIPITCGLIYFCLFLGSQIVEYSLSYMAVWIGKNNYLVVLLIISLFSWSAAGVFSFIVFFLIIDRIFYFFFHFFLFLIYRKRSKN
jgi:hypothetical protein